MLPSPLIEKLIKKFMRNEKMTIRQQMDDHAAAQGTLRVTAEIRRLAREHGASPELVESLVLKAHDVFRPANGGIFPFAPDGKTILRAQDGGDVLTVADWTRQSLAAAGIEPGPAPMPLRNPFKRQFWNITQQMRLRREDPEQADRLKNEAWQTGDLKSLH